MANGFWRLLIIRICYLGMFFFTPSFSFHSAAAADGPATVSEAKKVVDLSAIKLIGKDPQINTREVAFLSYSCNGAVESITKELIEQLKQLSFKENGDSTITPQYASATMSSGAFTLSLSIMPSGQGDQVLVNVQNHGNVSLAALPRPKDAKEVYATPVVAAYLASGSVEDTTKQYLRLFTEAGWEPYGTDAVGFYVRKNAVRVQAFIGEAPAQGGKTMVQLSSIQMSASIPTPSECELISYTDSTKTVLLQTKKSEAEVIEFYKLTLGKDRWKATTDQPFKVDFWDHMIFRNPEKDLIEIEFKEIDGKTQATVEFQTAAQVDALEQRAKLAMQERAEAKKAEEAKAAAQIATLEVTAPQGAKLGDHSESKISYSIGAGKAKTAVTAWLKGIESQGWKLTTNVNEGIVGDFVLNRGESEIHVTFTDTGFGNAEIEISAFTKSKLKPR
ncbi:MAG: hypothetical protein KDB03_10245 [Planctomycetales bacterium]|nr:hypothetical protein [Planctomycetales bacterium]